MSLLSFLRHPVLLIQFKGNIMKFGLGIVFASLTLAISAPAFADDDAYVAAALSQSTGTVGFADGGGQDAVNAKALAECKSNGATDCQIAISGKDMCISLARATNKNSLGLGGGSSRAESQNKAMSECAKDGAQGCNIHDTYCAPQSIQ